MGNPEWTEPDDWEDQDEFLDCQMEANGYCGKVGTNECDILCPYRREQRP